MDSEYNEQSHKTEINDIQVVKDKKISCEKLFDDIQREKGTLYFKNKDKNFSIKLKNKSFCKIFQQSSLVKKLNNYILISEETVEINCSNELYDDNNGKIFQILKNKSDFRVTMAKDMNLENENNPKHIILKSKSINNILSKIDSLNEASIYIQISLTQFSYDYSSKIFQVYNNNKYNLLLNIKKIFYIVYSSINKDKKNIEEEKLKKYALSYYSIKKIMDMAEKDNMKKDNYLNLSLINEDIEEFEKKNHLYLNNLTKWGENMEIHKKFIENKENNIKNILDNNIEINRIKKVDNQEMNHCFNIFEEILNKNKKKINDDDNKNRIEDKNIEYSERNNKNKEEEILKMKNKKKEIEDAINNRYNRFIEIMHNNKDKKYINLQYLDLMEELNKKYSKYKTYCYQVKNDRFKDVLIPIECINNYTRYKTEYEKKQFVLVNLNSNENISYLVSINDIKRLYDEWTDFEKEQVINTENPQFEGKRINLYKANIVKIGEIKELPEQTELEKKIKEEKEEKDKNKIIGKESSKIYGESSDACKGIKKKEYIVITRVIKRKKKGK